MKIGDLDFRHRFVAFGAAGLRQCREREAGDKNRDADPLRRREAEVVMGLDNRRGSIRQRARDGIAKQIGRKNLAVEFFAAEQPREKR
jgi:hypothetical protein